MKAACAGMILLAAAGPAVAALPCNAYDEMVGQAVMVMQVDVESVVPPAGGGQGGCVLTGEIVRNFKGPHPVGTRIQTMVFCEAPVTDGGEPEVMVGATIWWNFAALAQADVVELHIAAEGGPAGYGAGVVLLEVPTDAPAWTSFCG